MENDQILRKRKFAEKIVCVCFNENNGRYDDSWDVGKA